jgi:hypothetical protein
MEGALVVAEYLDGNGALPKLDVCSTHIPFTEKARLKSACDAKDNSLTL